MGPKPGPHLAMAVLCNQVIEGKDGVLSIIRVVDRFVVTIAGRGVPATMPPTQAAFTLVIMLKSGNARGTHMLSIRPEIPSGEMLPPMKLPVLFEGDDDRGVNVVVDITLPITLAGVYWLDVLLGDQQVLTRIPLRVVYQPMPGQQAG